MATPNGSQIDALIARLFREPYRFDFFQAVRLFERLAHARAELGHGEPHEPVGQDHDPAREAIRFRAAGALSFSAAPISRARRSAPTDSGSPAPLEMTVNFMGLTGPSGVLPDHYTQLLIDRVRSKDEALRDFLDLFNHRTISLFYRAWRKYHVPTNYEQAQLDGDAADPITELLRCLVGRGTKGLRNRTQIDDEIFLFYGGLFAHRIPNAVSLESMLADYVGVPVQLLQFQGHWLRVRREDRSRLAASGSTYNFYNRLGVDVTIGERVWDVQSKFRIRLGPLTWPQFCRLMPNRSELHGLCELARSYVGPELEFDVQPVVQAEQVPLCCLVSDRDAAPRLGWNTWLGQPSRRHARSVELTRPARTRAAAEIMDVVFQSQL